MKDCQRASSIVVAALLLGGMAGQAAEQTTVDWWVLAGGGAASGAGSGSGAVQINDTIGQPITGGSSGTATDLNAGYWQQHFGPAAITDLRASIAAGPLLQLDWTAVQFDTAGHAITGVTYDVYRGLDDPYFAPVTAYNTDVSLPFVDSADPTVIGNPARSTYYAVKPVWGSLTGAASNRVGAFAFGLTPGGP